MFHVDFSVRVLMSGTVLQKGLCRLLTIIIDEWKYLLQNIIIIIIIFFQTKYAVRKCTIFNI